MSEKHNNKSFDNSSFPAPTNIHEFKDCMFNRPVINYHDISNYMFENCTGEIIISVEHSKDKRTVTISNPGLTVLFERQIKNKKFKNNAQLTKVLNKLLSEHNTVKFIQCSFANLTIDSAPDIHFEDCSGSLNIKSNSHSLNFDKNNFEKLDIESSNLKNVFINENNKGQISIINTKITNLNVIDKVIKYFTKELYILPFFLLIMIFCLKTNGIPYHTFQVFLLSQLLLMIYLTKRMFNVNKEKRFLSLNLIKFNPYLIFIAFPIILDFNFDAYLLNFWERDKNNIYIMGLSLQILNFISFFFLLFFNLFVCNVGIKKAYNIFNITFKKCIINKLEYKILSTKRHKWIINDLAKYLIIYPYTHNISIEQCNIESTSLLDLDGSDNKERIYYLLENKSINFDSFKNFKELSDDHALESFEFIINNRNKIHNNLLNEKQSFIFNCFSSLHLFILKIIYELFYRTRNIFISTTLILIIGSTVFNNNTMTISDTSVQMYLKTSSDKTGQKIYNVLDRESSAIYVPEFYRPFNSTQYVISKFVPFETEYGKLYHPNNPYTLFMDWIFRILGLIHSTAFIFIISRRFFARN